MIDRIISEKYKVIRELGRGGMGIIYEALHTSLNRTVAIKILHPQFTGDPAFLKRLHREARAMARLNHDAIIGVFDVAEDLGSHYIAMEYFKGKDLKQIMIEDGPLSQKKTLSIALQVAKALSYAHEKGVIHRDIKPSNIMINDAGEIKIADFGIAAATDEVAVTATGNIVGTPEYMSVEQAQGEELDGRSDLYSLGMVIHELVTGKTTFGGTSGVAILGKLLYEKKEFDFSFPDNVSPSLQDLIKNLLKKNRDYRLADAASLIEKITTIQTELDTNPALSEAPRQSNISETLLVHADETDETMMLSKPSTSENSIKEGTPSSPMTVEERPKKSPSPKAAEKLKTSTEKKSDPVTPQSKNKLFLYMSVAVIAVIIVTGIFFNDTSTEKKELTPPRQDTSQIDEVRDIQRSIEAIESKLRLSKQEADNSDALHWAKEIYDEALDLEGRGLGHLKDADNFLEEKAFPSAKENLLTAKSLFVQADEGFLKAKQTAALMIVKEEKNRIEVEKEKQQDAKSELERLRQERIEAEQDREKQEAIARIEQEKLLQERDKTEIKRLERERLAQERIEIERDREKQEAIARIKSEKFRKERDKAERERAKKERERLAQERIRVERERKKQEKILIARNKAIRKISPPISGDSDILGGILNRLKLAYENKDLAALQRMSRMPMDRSRFFSRLFQDYETIDISVVDLSIIGQSAYAIVSITKLTSNKEAPTLPSKKMKDSKLTIHKKKGKWGKVIW